VSFKTPANATDEGPVTETLTSPTSLVDLLRGDGIRAVYQPIVDLDGGETAAYESLVRGPAGSTLDTDGPLLEQEDEIRERGLRVIVEFTERELATRPAAVLRSVEWLRDRGFGIALDDIGADPRSLALLPFVAPDVMKLDMALVQEQRPTRATAHVVNAVVAEAERPGAIVLAEGIETDEHLTRACAFGATLGQGWYFGRPGELTHHGPTRAEKIPLRPAASAARAGTPFTVLSDELPLRQGTKRVLLALSRQLEAEAEMLGEESVVLATFQEEGYFTARTRGRYEMLAGGSALIGALGVGMGPHPAPGVRGGPIAPDDPLRGEWDVVVIGPHFAGAFTARDLEKPGPDMDREFEFCISFDRELVLEVARIMLARVLPTY
jgi:EAL domain-containing protein (putative c-di-GMP-specific phosphodiesterase class I)